MSLKKQTFSGLIWTFIDTFFVSGISFLAMIFIARVLGPKEFGLIGMIALFIAIGTSLVDSGLSSSIIRTKNADNSDFSTVFYLNLGMSFAVYLALFLLAPFIASFFEQSILVGVIRLYCISFIISAFTSIQLALLHRSMDFKRIMFCNTPSTIIGVVVAVVLSLKGYGVWSIVWMQLTKQLIQSALLWAFSKWKPTLTFSKEKMKIHYGFGYKLMLSGLLNTVFDNIYNILIGKFYAVQTLGYYERAKTLNNYPMTVLTGVITQVTYPLLSKIQDEKEKVSSIYKQLIQLSFFVSAPLMLGAAAIASPLFELFLGKEWMPAVPYFQIICLASMLLPIHSFNLNILKVFGKSNLLLKIEIYKKLVMVLVILISLPFGILGLIWSSVIISFIALLINTHYSQSLIDYKTTKQLIDLAPILMISGIISFIMFVGVYLLQDYSNYFQILVPSIVGIVLYFGINYILQTNSIKFGLQLIKGNKQ